VDATPLTLPLCWRACGGLDYYAIIPDKVMKNAFCLAGSLMMMALATRLPAQTADVPVSAVPFLAAPTNTMLVLSNATGEVRVLDTRGLVLEANMAYLPRVQLTDLSEAELRALLETKTAYATLTTFASLHETNGSGPVFEKQLEQAWHQGKSLAEKIQTRLEILADLREYNINVALLPGSMAAASDYEAYASHENDRLTNRAATTAIAAEQVELTEQERAAGSPDPNETVHQAHDVYHETKDRLDRANDRAMLANGAAAAANQQVEAYLAKCAAISARLGTHAISGPAYPPFFPIPPLTMKAEVDAERVAH